MPLYVPLRVRSNYSLLAGASSVDALLAKAKRSGITSLAITDENNLYGAVEFFQKAREAGIRPILGALVDGPEGEALLLVRDAAGYANLCRIISARNLEAGFSLVATVAERQAGLFVLTPDPALAEKLSRRLDHERLRLELIRPVTAQNAERRLLEAAKQLGLCVAASCDVYFADEADFDLHTILSAMRENRVLAEMHEKAGKNTVGYLRTPEEFSRLFRDLPEAVAATREIAEACEFDLLAREPVFPKLPGDSAGKLREDALAGARSRYGKLSGEVVSRLDRELDLITRLGFADYFLVVADIVRHARELGTPVAGRGSGASSVVAYSLGITNVDPIRFNLPFERFLNEGRRDFPDLDIDFCWRLRDDVIDYVYRKHGNDRVAMIATYATMQPRLAFREAAKALGLSNPVITEVARKLRRGLPRGQWNTLPADPKTVELALRFAARLEGFPHHLSVHCGGVVITPDAISGHAPLERAEKGVVITQYDKDGVEAVGLVKLDLLGNRALSSVGEAVRLVGENRGAPLDPESLPERDPATERLLASGDTVGVNQLESPAMRHLLRQLRPTCVRDLMQVLALIRPGAASLGMKEAFVRRARGLDPVPPIDPRLDAILGRTHGVMLYEDDALFIASALAGLPLEAADRFRRAVTKCRSDEARLALSKDFLGRCKRNGTDEGVACDLWVQMAKFNSYSFCRAHAASYARLAWANAYMKAHHPAEFWVAALNNNQSMYPHWVYVEEVKRAGIRVLLPCVNRSEEEFRLEDGAARLSSRRGGQAPKFTRQGGSIRVGLARVAELTSRGRDSVLAARPFDGLADLIARTELRLGEAENLIRAAALDFIGRSRPELLLELHVSFEKMKRLRGKGALFSMSAPPAGRTILNDYSAAQKWRDEWRLLGLSARRHPVAFFSPNGRRGLEKQGILPSRAIPGHVGKRIRLAGIVAAARTTPTAPVAKGDTMCFVTLADEDGLFEVTLFPDVYRRHAHGLSDNEIGPFTVEGRVESQYDAVTVTAEGMGPVASWPRSVRPFNRGCPTW